MTWPITTVVKPSGIPTVAKNTSRLMPIRISGITIGTAASVRIAGAPRKRYRNSSQAPRVPRTTEIAVVSTAMTKLFCAARSSGALDQTARYHSKVKPVQRTLSRDALNE